MSDSVASATTPATVPDVTTTTEAEADVTTTAEASRDATAPAEAEADATAPAEAEADATAPAEAEADATAPAATGAAPVTAPPVAAATDSRTADSRTADSRTADIVAGPGGVMTDEVGVVTGDLTLRSELSDGQVTLHVQYKDADEWYVVTGGRAPLRDPADLDSVHTLAMALLHRPEG